jgi:hypothetical protein
MLLNMVEYAVTGAAAPLREPKAGFREHLSKIGYL